MYLLIGYSLAAVLHMDDSPAAKSVLFQQFLHGKVIPVGVNPQVTALAEGPIQAEGSGALLLSGRGDTVDDTVGAGAAWQPRSVFDLVVIGFMACKIDESTKNLILLPAYIADPPGNVLTYQLLRRIGILPLFGIAILLHEAAGIFIEL